MDDREEILAWVKRMKLTDQELLDGAVNLPPVPPERQERVAQIFDAAVAAALAHPFRREDLGAEMVTQVIDDAAQLQEQEVFVRLMQAVERGWASTQLLISWLRYVVPGKASDPSTLADKVEEALLEQNAGLLRLFPAEVDVVLVPELGPNVVGAAFTHLMPPFLHRQFILAVAGYSGLDLVRRAWHMYYHTLEGVQPGYGCRLEFDGTTLDEVSWEVLGGRQEYLRAEAPAEVYALRRLADCLSWSKSLAESKSEVGDVLFGGIQPPWEWPGEPAVDKVIEIWSASRRHR